MRHSLRACFVVGVLLCTTMSLPAAGDVTSSGPGLTEVAGETVIVGRRSAWTDVHLPSPVKVMIGKTGAGQVVLKGGGRISGFALVEEAANGRPRSGIYGFRFGHCPTVGCAPESPSVVLGGLSGNRAEILPAGKYRLYIVADGSPVRISLRLPGLEGKVRVAPDKSGSIHLRSPASETVQTTQGRFSSAGFASELQDSGLVVMGAWVRGDTALAGLVGHCIYEQEPPPDQLAFLPPCPTADYSPRVISGPETPGGSFFAVIEGAMLTTPKALGAYYASAAQVADAGFIATEIEF